MAFDLLSPLEVHLMEGSTNHGAGDMIHELETPLKVQKNKCYNENVHLKLLSN